MRITGLITLILGVIFMLLPFYARHVPFMHISANDGRLIGGLLVALGAIAVGISKTSER